MTDPKFDTAFKVVLQHEGGYTNDPSDHGGPTNWGITQHDLAVYRGHPVTADDVKHMPVEEAGAIYRKMYWTPYLLDQVNDGRICTLLFDMGVLNGPRTAIKMMQTAAGCTADGVVGPKTLAAINGAEPKSLGAKFLDQCANRFRGIAAKDSSQNRFLRGWLNRVDGLRKIIA